MEQQAYTDDEPPSMPPKPFRAPGLLSAIVAGMCLGAGIGVAVGVFLRPREDLAQLSKEWLEELQDMTQSVADRVRSQMRDGSARNGGSVEAYEELPESYT
jgi:hypothetical protein